MQNEVIKLISEVTAVNEYGDMVKSYSEKTVFADLKSIGQSEFYQAQANGLKPEIKFVLADCLDYTNEKIIKYQGFNDVEEETYTVIRTYRSGNSLELVCKRGVD